MIFEYSGYALHSGYANVYWSAIVRLGLLFPLPPRSREKDVGSKEDAGLEQEGTSNGPSARLPPSNPYGPRCARCRVYFQFQRKSAMQLRRVHLFAGCRPVPRTHGVLRRQERYPVSRQKEHQGASGRRLRQHGVMHVSLVYLRVCLRVCLRACQRSSTHEDACSRVSGAR